MKKYPKYKDSGIEWIGEIPEHWEAKKVKFLTKYFKGLAFSSTEFKDKGIPIVKASNIKSQSIKNILSYIDYDNQKPEFNKVRLKEGDIIISTVGSKPEVKESAVGQLGYIDNEFENAYLNQNTVCIRPTDLLCKEFLKFCFLGNGVRASFDSFAQWIANQAYIEIENIRSIYFSLPEITEQKVIANFLDKKTAQIDETIAKKERLIELLEEERKAIINHAVTKGINPNVKLKPSGIEWLGDIPEHWEVKKLRYLGTCQNGINIGAEYFGEGYPFVSYGDVYNNPTIPENVKGLVRSTVQDRVNYSVQENDVFFTRTSETIEEIGYASTCLNTIEDGTFAGFLIRFRPFKDALFNGFSKHYFRSQLLRKFFVKEMNIVTRASLSQELLKNLPVVLPPIKEQELISQSIEKQLNRTDLTISNTKKEIELLKEYRQALIFEAVTGKIDVRE